MKQTWQDCRSLDKLALKNRSDPFDRDFDEEHPRKTAA